MNETYAELNSIRVPKDKIQLLSWIYKATINEAFKLYLIRHKNSIEK